MYRATTPSIILVLPDNIDASNIAVIKWTFEQNGTVVLEKTKDDIQIDDNKLSVKLSQTETKAFDAEQDLVTQARFKTIDDTVFATKKMKLRVDDVLNDEVI